MKHLLSALLLVCSFALVGCGGGGGSPGDAVKELTYAMEAGDADKVKELVPDLSKALPDDKIDLMVEEAASEAKESGGIKSITIDKEEIDGDTAKVTATMTNGNGETESDEFELKKVDGKWVLSMGDMKEGAATPDIDLSGGDVDFSIEEEAE